MDSSNTKVVQLSYSSNYACTVCMTVEWNWSRLLNGKSKNIIFGQDKAKLLSEDIKCILYCFYPGIGIFSYE